MLTSKPPRPATRPRGRWLSLLLGGTLALGGCHSLALPPHEAGAAPETAVVQAVAKFGVPVGAVDTADEPASLPTLEQRPIDLCGALERAGFGNPTIALAEEAIRASEALRLQADALLLPNLNAGTNVRVHQGTLLSSFGVVRNVNLQSLYLGAGAGAKAAETVAVPGIQLLTHLADAYYAPQEARQQVIASRFDAFVTRNRTLLEVGTAYLALSGAQGELTALRRSAEDVELIAQLTANFAKAGQGKESDAVRARTQRLLLETRAQQAEEQLAVAAADLARLLDLDPALRLMPTDPLPPLLELVEPAVPLGQLLETALARHPELGARSADVATATIHVRQERARPWLPLVIAGFSYGNLGGAGNQSDVAAWRSGARIDVDVAAVWTLQNLGAGNRARQIGAQAEVGQAEAQRLRTANRVRAEVASAFAAAQARRRGIEIARRRIETAKKAFEEDLLRSRNLEGRPIEVLRSVELLTTARLDLVRAMVGYSRAQLELYVALGNTPACPAPPTLPVIQ